jgi:hypothetical protein
MESSPELADLTLRLYEALTRGDMAFIEGHISRQDGVIAIGTDPKEWWSGHAAFLPALRAQLQEMGGSFPIAPGQPRAYRHGAVGWVADQPLFQFPDGSTMPSRLTLVCQQEDGAWKVVQWHVSVGVANEELLGRELTV